MKHIIQRVKDILHVCWIFGVKFANSEAENKCTYSIYLKNEFNRYPSKTSITWVGAVYALFCLRLLCLWFFILFVCCKRKFRFLKTNILNLLKHLYVIFFSNSTGTLILFCYSYIAYFDCNTSFDYFKKLDYFV